MKDLPLSISLNRPDEEGPLEVRVLKSRSGDRPGRELFFGFPKPKDISVLSEMLRNSGIEFEAQELIDGRTVLTVHEGYLGFFTNFEFADLGKLESVKVFE